jgi:hypothetical protein
LRQGEIFQISDGGKVWEYVGHCMPHHNRKTTLLRRHQLSYFSKPVNTHARIRG